MRVSEYFKTDTKYICFFSGEVCSSLCKLVFHGKQLPTLCSGRLSGAEPFRNTVDEIFPLPFTALLTLTEQESLETGKPEPFCKVYDAAVLCC